MISSSEPEFRDAEGVVRPPRPARAKGKRADHFDRLTRLTWTEWEWENVKAGCRDDCPEPTA